MRLYLNLRECIVKRNIFLRVVVVVVVAVEKKYGGKKKEKKREKNLNKKIVRERF